MRAGEARKKLATAWGGSGVGEIDEGEIGGSLGGGKERGTCGVLYRGERRPKPTPITDKFPIFGEIRFEVKSLIPIQIRLGLLGNKGEERGGEVRGESRRF